MKYILRKIALVSLVLSLSGTTRAGEAEDRIIEKVKQSYNIHKIKTLSIYSDYRVGNRGQGYTPEYSEYTPMIYETHLDLRKKQGSSENWDGNYHFRYVTTDDGVMEIDYMNKTFELDTDGTYYRAIGNTVPRSDTLLAYELVTRPDNSVVKETVNYRGMPHTVMILSIPGWAPMNLFVNSDTGHITKMERNSRIGKFHFQFGNFKKKSGVTYGSDYSFFIDGHLSEITQGRRIEVNKSLRRAFKIDRGLKPLREKMDRSEMTIDRVGDKVFYVGKGIGYTAFIEADSYIIGIGATSGLSERIEAYNAYKGDSVKPLRYFIVDHHHDDHLRGLATAEMVGVKYVVPEIAIDNVRSVLGDSVSEERIQVLSDKTTIGPVEIYNISTSHTAEFALTYIPEAKIIIQVDHMGALFIEGPGFAKADTLSLKSEIDKLGLDVNKMISLHNRKVENWDDFSNAVSKFDPNPCPSRRAICR